LEEVAADHHPRLVLQDSNRFLNHKQQSMAVCVFLDFPPITDQFGIATNHWSQHYFYL